MPSSRRVLSAMTTVFGSAIPCRRAARFGVSPTIASLLRFARADQVADDHEPGRDPDTHLQQNTGGGLDLQHRLDQGKPGPHRALGIVLMGLGIAEIGQHSVAHVLGDEAAGLGDEIGAAAVVCADDLAHILGVEARREGGRTDQIAEHDGELTAFSGVPR